MSIGINNQSPLQTEALSPNNEIKASDNNLNIGNFNNRTVTWNKESFVNTSDFSSNDGMPDTPITERNVKTVTGPESFDHDSRGL